MSIRADNLSFAYFEDGKSVLNGLTAEFDRSEITVLTGVSGSGKSTLLYLAAGLYPHHAGFLRSGTVEIEGQQAAALPASKRCRLAGMMFQNPDLQFCMDTVYNELVFTLENICLPSEVMERTIDDALTFSGIPHLKHRTLNSLSGGEKQRVALACVTALSPAWLLLDEPFANIDDASAREILERLLLLHREQGVGILAVDHRLENWLDTADCVRVLQNGTILPERLDLSDQAGSFGRLGELGISIPGEDVSRVSLPAPQETGDPILRIEHLSLRHPANGETPEKMVLRDVNADFYPGHIYALIGRSGSGKSSLFGALSGLYSYQGQVFLDGEDLKRARKKQAGAIGFVTQNPQDQFIGGSVRDEISAAFRKAPDRDERSEAILRSIRLWRYRDISPYMLSQGQQRRLGVAALLAYTCQVLICDEPTYAQDRDNTAAIMNALCRQARERGIALIFSTHDRRLAWTYADTVYELKEGVLYETDQSVL